MKEKYDVIVVGAGPAGSTTARIAAAAGLSVLLLEKDAQVGVPVRCGEAVSNQSIRSLVDFDERWISATVRTFRLIAPNGTEVEPDLGGIGYILDRTRFDYDLAMKAVECGAELVTGAFVTGLLPAEKGWNGVTFMQNGKQRRVSGDIIVGADGVESRIGVWAGIDTTTPMRDMETCAQMLVENIRVDEDACEFYFGKDIAPTGYLWVFPKGDGRANIGVGISGAASRTRHALSYLKEFVARRYPDGNIVSTIAGGVPCAATLPQLVKENVVLVGDAAHQVNPMSGGGITSGMRGGKLAGEAIVRAVANSDRSLLHSYEKEWEDLLGAKHRWYYKMKQAVYRFPDEMLNTIADRFQSLPPEKRTLWVIFRTALIRHPSLVWDMVKVFGEN